MRLENNRQVPKIENEGGMLSFYKSKRKTRTFRAAFKSVGALGPDLIWAPLNTPKNFFHVYSTQHPVSMNFCGHGRKVSL